MKFRHPLFRRVSFWMLVLVGSLLGGLWVLSMIQMAAITWCTGPSPGGVHVVQFSSYSGALRSYVGESGFGRSAGIHFDERMFESDEERGVWFPPGVGWKRTQSGFSLDVSYWFLITSLTVLWLGYFGLRDRIFGWWRRRFVREG